MKKIASFFTCSFIIANSFAQGTWIQKANFGGTGREFAAGFSIGTKGYIGTGEQNGGTTIFDFYEYDSGTDTWTQKADLPANSRKWSCGYSVGNQTGYLIMGYSSGFYYDGYSYDPGSNTWAAIPNFPGTGRFGTACFAIGAKLYVVTGGTGASTPLNDTWEYNSGTGAWTQKTNFAGNARWGAAAFAIGNYGYVGTGSDGTNLYNDFYEFDQAGNNWIAKANFPGSARQYATGFKIGSAGFIGAGFDGLFYQDFYQYNPVADTWSNVTQFPGNPRWAAMGFEINGNGYFGLGGTLSSSGNYTDWWELIPSQTGISENTDGAFELFPNPCKDVLKIHNKNSRSTCDVVIVDAFGRNIYSKQFTSGEIQINTSDLPNGVYFIQLKSESGVASKKFIKE
jgi:N-acetylneuraminic acid mutarotase